MAKHLHNLYIHDYRGIHELNLSSLNDINIFTGNNNCGKTSVLELISTIGNSQDLNAWELCSRMKNVRSMQRLYYNGFYNIFPIDCDEKKIVYEYTDVDMQVHKIELKAEISKEQVSEENIYKMNGFTRCHKKNNYEFIESQCMHLSIFHNGKIVNKDCIYDFQTMLKEKKLRKTDNHQMMISKIIYISPTSHVQGHLLLDKIISDSKLYDELLHILKEFDDSIISVNAIHNSATPYSTDYVILTRNHKEALPLASYGDGMKKAILLLSAIVEARDGILLLDEFETAIHTSAMDSIFSWLLKSALKFHVQVFLTSHSKEAIEKLLKVDESLKSHIHLYTLYDYNGKNYVRMMNCEEAIHAQDILGLELR